jgi:hypothetical protein
LHSAIQLFFGFGLILLFGAAVAGGASPDFSAFGTSIAFTHEIVSLSIVYLNLAHYIYIRLAAHSTLLHLLQVASS